MMPVKSTKGIIGIRQSTADDRPYLIKSCVLSLTPANNDRAKAQRPVIGSALGDLFESSNVSIACIAASPEVIVGYAIGHSGSICNLHVRDRWRGLGIESALLEATI